MMELSKAQLAVIQLENELKERNLFSREHMKKLKAYKADLQSIIEIFEYQEDTSYHELMIYANAKAIMSLPESQINIFITRILLFKSTEEMAVQLNVCRPTLTKYITNIKTKIKKDASDIIQSYSN